MALSAGSLIGPFEIIAPLGAGGMGEVYRARDAKLGRDVALKILPPAFAGDADRMARFQREAQVLASLNHPNIAAIYGLEESGGVPALVMELVEGPTLAERIALGPIPVDEALPIARQIAEALESAHDKGIIHRDLKPANIKLTADGKVKVLDFGLAKALEGKSASGDPTDSPTLTLAMTGAGVILGTASYMSPEQAKGKSVDRRADIWSFGVVLIEMLTAQRMYAGETVSETLAAVIMTAPSIDSVPAATPSALRKLLARCLEKDPRRRLRDIGEARIAIEDIISGAAAPEPAAVAPAPIVDKPRLTLIPWIVTGVLFLAVALLAWMHFREPPPAERTLRYAMPLPPKAQLHSMALSPDGRYLAFVARAEGKQQLWLRALDALEAQPMPGTEGAQYPFWSPDSRYIGFFAQGKLQKIAANGGPTLVLCDAPNGRGGTWSRDNLIVFAPGLGIGLGKVPAVGGVPTPVTTTKADHRFPIFLPDGRHVLYVATLDAQDKNGIFIASVDGKENRRLLPDLSSVLFVAAAPGSRYGHLLLIRQETLMAQPMDLSTLQPSGELFPVAQRVYFGSNNNYMPAATSQNGVLIYATGQSLSENQLVWYDRGGKPSGNAGPPGSILSFALSPDARTVAMPRGETTGKGADIWLYDSARGTQTRFTFHGGANLASIWSAKGDRIVFSSDQAHSGRFDLYTKASSGAGEEELLLENPHNKAPDQWTAVDILIYEELDPKLKLDLWLLDLKVPRKDRKPVVFLQTPFNEVQGQLSPDHKWLAYSSDESGRFEVYVRPFPAADGKWQISTAGGEMPRWRGDGKEIYYVTPENKLMAVAITAGAANGSFNAGTPEALFETRMMRAPFGYRPYYYSVTADGKRFLIENTGGDTREALLTVMVNWLSETRK